MPAANQIRHGWIMLGIPQHQQGIQVSGLHKIVKIRFHVFSGNDWDGSDNNREREDHGFNS
jgi:hypothetical protein